MAELLHNPNSSKLIPRKSTPSPAKKVSLNSINEDNTKKSSISKKVDSVTFDTTLRIDNHLKNFMKAMVILGDTPTQQRALKKLQDAYFEGLTDDEQKTLQMQISTLENGDALKYKNNK